MKGFHSIVLMAVVDAEYRFMFVDIGGYGSEGDSAIFRDCDFGKALLKKQLNLPEDRVVYGKSTPHVFLGDDAFPLHRNIMKPFSPSARGNPLTDAQRIFNYR
jgi:DDE superfamily endonuclease